MDIKLAKNTKVVVVGDIHGHDKQLFDLLDIIKPSAEVLFVSVGDLIDRGFGPEAEKKIINKIRHLSNLDVAFTIKGNHELKNIRKAKSNNSMTDELTWLDTRPLSLSFVFANNTRLTVVHGGVKPSMTWKDLEVNTDLCYIRYLDEAGEKIPLERVVVEGEVIYRTKRPGKPWHELYDGRFGYIASGHEPQGDGIPKFFKHSCNLDTAVFTTGVLTAQVFSESGREELIQITGPTTGDHKVYIRK